MVAWEFVRHTCHQTICQAFLQFTYGPSGLSLDSLTRGGFITVEHLRLPYMEKIDSVASEFKFQRTLSPDINVLYCSLSTEPQPVSGEKHDRISI